MKSFCPKNHPKYRKTQKSPTSGSQVAPVKQIARAKSELIGNINKKGFVILNKEDKYFDFFKRCADQKEIKVVSFGFQKGDLFLLYFSFIFLIFFP